MLRSLGRSVQSAKVLNSRAARIWSASVDVRQKRSNAPMGAEIGISTDKIGARGPMGLEELTSYKWIGIGNGQIRT